MSTRQLLETHQPANQLFFNLYVTKDGVERKPENEKKIIQNSGYVDVDGNGGGGGDK